MRISQLIKVYLLFISIIELWKGQDVRRPLLGKGNLDDISLIIWSRARPCIPCFLPKSNTHVADTALDTDLMNAYQKLLFQNLHSYDFNFSNVPVSI
jgi:hypothetical protein